MKAGKHALAIKIIVAIAVHSVSEVNEQHDLYYAASGLYYCCLRQRSFPYGCCTLGICAVANERACCFCNSPCVGNCLDGEHPEFGTCMYHCDWGDEGDGGQHQLMTQAPATCGWQMAWRRLWWYWKSAAGDGYSSHVRCEGYLCQSFLQCRCSASNKSDVSDKLFSLVTLWVNFICSSLRLSPVGPNNCELPAECTSVSFGIKGKCRSHCLHTSQHFFFSLAFCTIF
jgi:hypothetical protein